MTNDSIRPAVPDELPALAALWREKMVLLGQTDPRFKLSSDALAAWQAGIENWLQNSQCAIFVADGEDAPAGFTIGWVQLCPPGVIPERIGVITELALDMHSYQRGLGRALVIRLRAWFNEQGINQIVALVPRRHAVQQAFWRSMGATEWIDVMWIK